MILFDTLSQKKNPFTGRVGERANNMKRGYNVSLNDIERQPAKQPKLVHIKNAQAQVNISRSVNVNNSNNSNSNCKGKHPLQTKHDHMYHQHRKRKHHLLHWHNLEHNQHCKHMHHPYSKRDNEHKPGPAKRKRWWSRICKDLLQKRPKGR